VLFQLMLITSGNLSFLNWLTIVPALACFDDAVWERVLPRALVRRARRAAAAAQPSRAMQGIAWALAAGVAVLSIGPVANMLSPDQIMNTSFTSLDLVNTYGAFGTVGRERLGVVFEGTDGAPDDEGAVWKPYPYLALPADRDSATRQIAPYQPRLDWQMWFAAMSTPDQYPWTLHLIWKLLHGDPGALSLFRWQSLPGPIRRASSVRRSTAIASRRPANRTTGRASRSAVDRSARRGRPPPSELSRNARGGSRTSDPRRRGLASSSIGLLVIDPYNDFISEGGKLREKSPVMRVAHRRRGRSSEVLCTRAGEHRPILRIQ
jgi:hypothetical protein